ncbi:Putative aarF domain-containing protein kinase, chloroplastic [Glycine soja]|uniref:Putative aarF domain-containing protein kinase, chloroplastic n=1 Tax=Glycine soja TaxID=3848 RepID=A0A0B2QDC8_GLYSO|nr:Putative aarF domain-containing protein kinase, chloroplastic [Glycine soja]
MSNNTFRKKGRRFWACTLNINSSKKEFTVFSRYAQVRDLFSSRRFQDSMEKLPNLVADIVQTSLNTGPRGVLRLAQGVQAFLGVGQEWLTDVSKSANSSTGLPTELKLGLLFPFYLRRLFERMGATYIKLGQASISQLKHKLHKILKSQEIILEEKRVKDEERMETHPSHIKKTEGIKEIKMWLERWMQEQDIMLEDKITNKQSIQEEINAHSPNHVNKTMEGSGSECGDNTEVHSWTRKVQLATFGGCTKGEAKEDHLVCVLHQALETINTIMRAIHSISTNAVPFEEIESILRKELGKPLESVYEYIDPTPVASASIPQVHGARLKGSWEDVVIKSMLEEVDFYKEAANIEAFRRYLETMGLTGNATAPKVYQYCSTKKVLTMQRLYGVPLTDLDSISSLVSNPETSLITALNVWFGSLLACKLFHADVHAGNLWLLHDGHIGFLNFEFALLLKQLLYFDRYTRLLAPNLNMLQD